MNEDIAFLQRWFSVHCDGDWEHGSGIKLSSLENPGWSLEVNLLGAELEDVLTPHVVVERGELDWTHAWSDGRTFNAVGGPENLAEIIGHFRAFVEAGVTWRS